MKNINVLVLTLVLAFISTLTAMNRPLVHAGFHLIPTRKDQDRLDVQLNINDHQGRHFFGVYDGHGDLNVHVAQIVKDKVRKDVAAGIAQGLSGEQAIKSALKAAERHVSSSKYAKGGTTAVNAFIDGATLYISNVGDSRAVLGREAEDGALVAYQPIEDHGLENGAELSRLAGIGAKTSMRGCFTHDQANHAKSPSWVCPDEGEHNLAVELYGMRFTRSIGDFASKKAANSEDQVTGDVILSIPEIEKIELTQRDRFLILASDGVWESSIDRPVTNNQAISLVSDELAGHSDKQEGAKAAAKALALEAKRRWGNDDISVIIIVFDWSERLGFAQKMMRDLALGGINAVLLPAYILKNTIEAKTLPTAPAQIEGQQTIEDEEVD